MALAFFCKGIYFRCYIVPGSPSVYIIVHSTSLSCFGKIQFDYDQTCKLTLETNFLCSFMNIFRLGEEEKWCCVMTTRLFLP